MMHSYKRFVFSILLFCCFPIYLFAANKNFLVQRIQIEGLQNISANTVRSYLPIHEGQSYSSLKGDNIIAALYKTGFFDFIQLNQKQNTLIVKVSERPIISLIHYSGNKELGVDKLKPVAKQLGISEGLVFDPAKLQEFKLGLEQQYASLGYHAAFVNPEIKPLSRNRIALTIQVVEGPIVKVHSIKIMGAHAFSEKEIESAMKLTTPNIFTWFTHVDRYSKQKLNIDLQNINNFYLDHGYLRFKILTHHAKLTPNHKGIDIVLTVSEGPLYRMGDFKIIGETFGQTALLSHSVTFKAGDVFSRHEVIRSVKRIGHYLADRGYAFANAQTEPRIDDAAHIVYITFNIVPGKMIYIRRINFYGNQSTNEEVLRREMRQTEGGVYSLAKINESKHRLALLPYFDPSITKINLEPVPDAPDQVDLNFHVKEAQAGRASFSAGYGSGNGFLYGLSINHPNFLGSGDQVGLGFQNSQISQSYFFNFFDPYYTVNNVGRGYGVYYNKTNYTSQYNYQPYNIDSFGTNLFYSFPLTEFNRFTLGFNYEHAMISHVTPVIAPSVLNFLGCSLDQHGDIEGTCDQNYDLFKITTGWSYVNLDRAIFPRKGLESSLSAEIGVPIFKSSLGYYKTNFDFKYYQPLFSGFIANIDSTIGYGNGFGGKPLPFFLNYFAGGIDGGLPAYTANTLGPKNCRDGSCNGKGGGTALGGNLVILGGFHLILPQMFTDKLRVALTFDAGNVFQVPRFPGDNPSNGIIQNETFSLRNIRAAYGILLAFNLPVLHQIGLSLAFPVNKKHGDDLNAFQFSLGGAF